MILEYPAGGDSGTDAALEHLAQALGVQRAAEGRALRARLADELRTTAPSDGPGAAGVVRALLARSPELADLVVQAPVDEVAQVLDSLARPGTTGSGGDVPDQRLPVLDGAIAAWGAELRRLVGRSGRRAADIAQTMTRRGFPETPLGTPIALDDPLLAESTVDALGGKWVEGSFRSLYRAARREWTRRTEFDRVERVESGFNAVNSPTPEFAARQLQAPIHALPVVRGRNAEVARVVSALDAADQRVQVLVGPAGYGKSTVALAAAERAEVVGRLVLWVPAHDATALVKGLELAAVRTGATVDQVESARSAPPTDQAARLWALLDDSPGQWLIVLDDAGEAAVGHADWVHRSRAGLVVVTSRFRSTQWGSDADVTTIGELAAEDGGRVVLDRSGVPLDATSAAVARELSRRLAGMPLALASAGRLASAGDTLSLVELVERLRETAEHGPLPAVYEVGLAAGSRLSDARAALRLLACFAPDEPLPLCVLGAAVPLAGLIEVGLVEQLLLPDHGQRCVRIHPAIAEHSRRDAAFDDDAIRRMTARAVALLRAELSRLDPGVASDWPAICLLEPHVSMAVESAGDQDDEGQAALLSLADATAEALVRAGRRRAAVALLDRALDATKTLGEPHPARLAAHCTAVWMMAFDRDLRMAELSLANLVEQTTRWLGPEHPHTLTARDFAAWLRAESGAVDEGRVELERVLIIRRRVFGDEHQSTLVTRQRLAWVSALCRREQYASDQLRDILRIRLAQRGPDHLDVFSTRYRLAWVLVRQGELAQAEQEFRDLREDVRRVVGERHPLTLMVRCRIGWVLKRRKRFTAARRTYTKVLSDQIYVLGHGHPRVLRTQHLLACLDLQLGRATEAVQALRSVAEQRETVLGPDHHDTLVSRSYLAWALLQSGDAAAADREFSAVLADRNRVYGPRHPLTLMTRDLHGRVLIKCGLLGEAERRLERLLVAELNLLGPDDRLVFETRHALAVVAGHLGRLDDAESWLRAVWSDRQRVLGPDHPDTLASRAYLVWVLGLRGRLAEAMSMCVGVIADRRRVLGAMHPHTLHSCYRAAWLAGLSGEWDRSLQMIDDLLPDLSAALGDRHPDTLRCRTWRARALRCLLRHAEAEREAQSVVAAQSRVQGVAAVDTLRAREELALILVAGGAHDRATTSLAALLHDRREALGDDHPDTSRSLDLWRGTLSRS